MQGLDIETVGLDPEEGKIRLVQIRNGDRGRVYDADDADLPEALRALEGSAAVAHNAPFERNWIAHHYGIELPPLHDTLVMSQVLYTGTNAARSKQFSHSLQAVVGHEIKRELDKTEQDGQWDAEVLTREQITYAALDAAVLPDLAHTLLRKIDRDGLRDVYELERRVSHAVAAMERNGPSRLARPASLEKPPSRFRRVWPRTVFTGPSPTSIAKIASRRLLGSASSVNRRLKRRQDYCIENARF